MIDISVDAVSGCKFCYVVVIYDTNYGINVAGACECGEEPSGTIKRGEFLD
jgi:hypothetical protein